MSLGRLWCSRPPRSSTLACVVGCRRLLCLGSAKRVLKHRSSTSRWSVTRVWSWPRPVHINVLEASSIYRLLDIVARRGGPLRFASLCDSNVARCALAKGRSPSKALARVTKRAALPFCPTRWMPADGPSRDSLPEPPCHSVVGHIVDPLERTALAGLLGLGVGLRTGCASSSPSLPTGLPLASFTAIEGVRFEPLSRLRWTSTAPWVSPVRVPRSCGVLSFSCLPAPSGLVLGLPSCPASLAFLHLACFAALPALAPSLDLGCSTLLPLRTATSLDFSLRAPVP